MFNKILMAGIAASSVLVSVLPASAAPLISNPGRYDGGRISIQTQTGTSCSSSAPDRASIGIAAGYEQNDYYGYGDNWNGSNNGGFVGGVYASMPLGGSDHGDCSLILEMEEQRARLDMAVTLFEAGGMSADELKVLAQEVRGHVMGGGNKAPQRSSNLDDVDLEDE